MSAYNKVLNAIQGKPENGHAIANQKNEVSLRKANSDIGDMFKRVEKELLDA